LIGGIPLLQRLHDHDVHHSDAARQGTGGIRDYFTDTVAVWMLRFVQKLQISVACRENPVTVMVIRTPVVKFLSYICRSVLEGKMKHLEALIPSLEAVHAIDASLLPALGDLLLLMWKGSDARICKEVLGNLHNEDRRQLHCRRAVLRAEQGSLAFGPTLCAPFLSFATKVAFLQRELKSVELLRERPALFPRFMYVAQCRHCADMSSPDDYRLTSRGVVENLLELAESKCLI
jgi:hypothetical protein